VRPPHIVTSRTPRNKLDAIHFGKANMIEESRGLLTFEAAEMPAVHALAWLAGEPEALSRFMTLSGIEATNFRDAAAEPGFLAGVLDFVTADDAFCVAFATSAGVPPERIVAARRTLNLHD
jgi:hypothetical protein